MSKIRRMSRIFAKDGKSITLALDGYYFSNKTKRIDETIMNLNKLIDNGLDAVLVTYGMAKLYENVFKDIGMLVRADISTGVFDPSVPNTTGVLTVEEALELGADGVISMTFPGADNERQSHEIARKLARDADKWNIPFMCETLPYGYAVTSSESNCSEVIATGARLGTEIGADIIKTRFSGKPGDSEIVKAAKQPVLALGGPKTESIYDYFEFVKHCIDSGAKGVAVGRNVIMDEKPAGVVAGLNVIIHEMGTVEEANRAYNTCD